MTPEPAISESKSAQNVPKMIAGWASPMLHHVGHVLGHILNVETVGSGVILALAGGKKYSGRIILPLRGWCIEIK